MNTRRDFIRGAGLGALAFSVGGATVLLTAREARARACRTACSREAKPRAIESLGETLVPGARAAGIAHFIDHQVSVPPEEALLEARILNVRPPYLNFYPWRGRRRRWRRRRGCMAASSRSFSDLERRELGEPHAAEQGGGLAGAAGGDSSTSCCAATRWTSSTAPREGYKDLGIPYMAHIAPLKRW